MTAASALLALAPPADATDFCVAPNTTCGGTNVATFQAALDQADNAADADRIFLGAATYTAPSTGGYDYFAQGSPLEVVGAGASQTVLTAPTGATRVMRLYEGAGSVISDLAVRVPAGVPGSSVGLTVFGVARRVAVTSDPVQSNLFSGVELVAGRFEDGAVTLPTTFVPNATGIRMVPTALPSSVARSTIVARTGVGAAADSRLERLRVTAGSVGIGAGGNNMDSEIVVAVVSSVVRPVAGGTGLYAFAQPDASAVLNADGVTVAGDGSAGTSGAAASNIGFPNTATLNLRSSIIRGTQRSLLRSADMGSGGASLTATYSDYDPAAVALDTGPGTLTPAAGTLSPGSNVNVDPRFVNAAAGDFHLVPGSPVIDLADPATPAGIDFDGRPLILDGDGDGTARRDMGAFERPVPAPPGGRSAGPDTRAALISRFRARPRRFAPVRRRSSAARVARGTGFLYRLDERARVTISVQRVLPGRRAGGSCRRPSPLNRGRRRCRRYVTRVRLGQAGTAGPNRRRFGGRVRGRALAAGEYRAVIRARDGAGNPSLPRRARFFVLPG